MIACEELMGKILSEMDLPNGQGLATTWVAALAPNPPFNT
jgi:hypothetical protein